MVMAPLDLRNREFKKAFRGYVEEEVDGFLELVTTDYEHLFRENLSLKEQLAKQDDNISHYRNLEDTLKSTLVLAQKTSEDVRSTAEKDSTTLMANARWEAELKRKEAEAKAEAIIKEAQERAKAIVQDYAEIQKQAHTFKVSLRALLMAQVEVLNQNFLTVENVTVQNPVLKQWTNHEQEDEGQQLADEQAAVSQEQDLGAARAFLKEPRYVPNPQDD
jgi:cell division initiation protein